MQKFAIIVAGGSGSRMKSTLPKQFLKIGHQPILMHTIEKFYRYDPAMAVILALPEQEFATWEKLKEEYDFKIPVLLSKGGATRFESVKNALDLIPEEESLVAVHDGVRPFVSLKNIEESFETAYQKGSAVTVIPLKDSIRKFTEEGSVALDRTQYCLVQTPQTFRSSILKKAYCIAYTDDLTDDASVVEKINVEINLVQGSYRNIKITSPEDMLIAEVFIKEESGE